MCASENGHTKTVKVLFQYRADVSCTASKQSLDEETLNKEISEFLRTYIPPQQHKLRHSNLFLITLALITINVIILLIIITLRVVLLIKPHICLFCHCHSIIINFLTATGEYQLE